MDKAKNDLPVLDLNTLVEEELKKIQSQPMSRKKVIDLYELYRKLEFVQRLGVIPKEKILEQKNKVFQAIEINIVTEY
jgi:hypothetical protein